MTASIHRRALEVAALISCLGCGSGKDRDQEPTTALAAPATECAPFNAYTAALAEATLACIGTLNPRAYAVDRNSGLLERKFPRCHRDPQRQRDPLQEVDALLSLQQREERLPGFTSCLVGQWEAWREDFLGRGNSVCPDFHAVEVSGAADAASVDAQIEALPKLPSEDTPGDVPIGKTSIAYEVRYPGPDLQQPCGNARSCAVRCVEGLPGFALGVDDDRGLFLGDPVWWLMSDVYSPTENPFLRAGYYHPMSYYGPLPGDVFGHHNRRGEKCSKWAGGTAHYQLTLLEDCLDPALPSTCLSLCTVP